LKITFLGTGTSTGIPIIGCSCPVCRSMDFRDVRLRTSVHLQIDDLSLVIDTSPDFRQQILTHRITKLDAVLFTHAHRDHTAGLDDVRPFNFFQKKDMPIYGSKAVLDNLRMVFSYAFAEKKYPGVPALESFEIENKPFKINDLEIIPILGLHAQMPVFGFRIGDFSYITDMNFMEETEKAKLKNSKILVLNALREEPHHSHFSLPEAIAIAQEVEAEQTYFTHISHAMGLHKTVESKLPENIRLAYDGLQISL